MKKFIIVLITIIPCSLSAIPSFNLEFNFSNAQATMRIIENKPDADLEYLLQLKSTKGLIEQTNRFDDRATKESYAIYLSELNNKNSQKNDIFNLRDVLKNAEEISSLLNHIINNKESLKNEIEKKLLLYVQQDIPINVTVYFIVGGNSDGFAPSDSTFYIDLNFFHSDYEGLKLLMTHELLHIIQNKIWINEITRNNTVTHINCHKLLITVIKEGSASEIANPLEIEHGEKYIQWFSNKYKKNLKRIDENFILFEMMLLTLNNYSEINYDNIYPLGFSGSWSSPLYFVGFHICKEVRRYYGEDVYLKTFNQNPLKFYKLFIQMYNENLNYTGPKFSKNTENIINNLTNDYGK